MLVPVRDNEAARSPRRPGRDRSESVSQGYAHWSKCVWGRNRLCIDPIGFHGLSTRKWSRRPQVSCQVRMGCHASLMALPFSAALLSTAHLLYEEQPALQAAPHGGGVTGYKMFTSAGLTVARSSVRIPPPLCYSERRPWARRPGPRSFLHPANVLAAVPGGLMSAGASIRIVPPLVSPEDARGRFQGLSCWRGSNPRPQPPESRASEVSRGAMAYEWPWGSSPRPAKYPEGNSTPASEASQRETGRPADGKRPLHRTEV